VGKSTRRGGREGAGQCTCFDFNDYGVRVCPYISRYSMRSMGLMGGSVGEGMHGWLGKTTRGVFMFPWIARGRDTSGGLVGSEKRYLTMLARGGRRAIG